MSKKLKTIVAGPLVFELLYNAPERGDSTRARQAKRRISSEAQRLLNRKHSYQKLELLIAANFVPGDWLVTLTYADDRLPDDRPDVVKHLKAFRKDLRDARKNGGGCLRMVWAVENVSGGGRWHVHAVVNACGRDVETIQRCWPWGHVELSKLQIDRDHSFEAVARYLCKEARERANLKSWSSTHNLTKPERDVQVVPDDTQLQPPRGATVYESQMRQTDWGAWRFVKYLLPDWRRTVRHPRPARRK